MSPQSQPLCPHHEPGVKMSLRSLHTESGRPNQLFGLFECPDCGEQRRVPYAAEARR